MKRKVLLFTTLLLTTFVFQGMNSARKNRTKVIAHRGAWKNTGVPQNSLASLQHAIRLGCYGSEFDVHMSADSVLVINHDHTIQGVALETTPAAQLAAIKLSNGEALPTLEAYLNAGKKQKQTRLILEIKASQVSKERSLALAEKCVEMVRKTKTRALVDYISFDYDVCKKVKELDPKAQVAYLNGDKTPEQLAADGFYGLDYHHSIYKKNENWIKEAQQKGLTLNVWTVNDQPLMEWFLERNVDFITTDQPELLLEITKAQ
ncbi:glycerophosphodiester phosphodiesterase [Telluribacter sp.]|uniref:glycerophosphodiester phosphodiesterase n=1 Tax=Telluribacter sp. TaxID=1978767 RepID=UPI002E0EE9E5|nr:glycerophosphodiester phosphodiesterase family protein [Telluribacter sp.]